MDAQGLINVGRQVDLARLPLWSGSKDSIFSAEQWIERIDKARAPTAGNWTVPTTMSYVYNALRGDAIVWFDALTTLGYDSADWEDFKSAFIRTYGTTKTARTAALNLSDIKQGQTESAARYISRVIKIISDVKDLAPAALAAPAQPFCDEIRNLAGWAGVADAIKTQNVQGLLQHGAKDAYNRIGMQLFIAGLKPILRTELMKINPTNMREAFDAVIDAEKITAEPQRNKTSAVLAGVSNNEEGDAESDADSDNGDEEGGDENDANISALTAKLKALKKKAAKKNKQKGTRNGSNNSNNKPQNGGQNASKPNRGGGGGGNCRYCNKEGHFQAECYSRKAAGAPMVDAQGKPFQARGVHALAAGGYMHQYQQQQQQQPHSYAHYGQTEPVGGGVGSIWNKQPWEQIQGDRNSYNNSLNY